LGYFAGVVYTFTACGINGAEVEDLVLAVGIPDEIVKNSTHSSCCIGDEDNAGYRGFDKLRYGFSRFVE
jgi:hypothetical protein